MTGQDAGTHAASCFFIKRKPYAMRMVRESFQRCTKKIPPSVTINLVRQPNLSHKRRNTDVIFDRHANLKYRYGNRKFWYKGFYVDTVGRNKKVIEEYIRNQLQEDIVAEQITMAEYIDPFTGEVTKENRKKKK